MSAPIVADMGQRACWTAPPPNGMRLLHDVLTADVDALTAEQGAWAALLTDKGRIRAIVRVLATGPDGALLDCDDGSVAGVEAGLVRIAPLGGVEMGRETRRLFRLVGPVPPDLDPGSGEADHSDRDGAIVVRTRWGGDGIDVLAPAADAPAWAERLGATADPAQLEPARIRDARPIYGVDVDEHTHVLETPLAQRYVSATKGCYPGQESVAKIRNLGRVRRRLVALDIAGAEAGDPVLDAHGGEAGRVTSVAGPLALAIVKVDAGPLAVDGRPATILDPFVW